MLIDGPVTLTRPDGRTCTIDARALSALVTAAKTLSRDLDADDRREIDEAARDLACILHGDGAGRVEVRNPGYVDVRGARAHDRARRRFVAASAEQASR